ncbi:MAG: potassium transporter TrkA [Candidatus Omnitrophica bacterium]|nr:potassium transporter TrkA [Candidatus Omnitrophota bacterium]
MIALFTLFAVIILSITVIRIGAAALELTGLSDEVASFQAQSAFSGAGFTTTEAESVLKNPVRRRIIRILILLGSAGMTSSIATFILTFVGQSGENIAKRAGILALGLLLIFFLTRSRLLYWGMKKIIKRFLQRYTRLRIYDYREILGLSKGYNICQINVKPDSWMVGKPLEELDLDSEGILILSITRRENGDLKFVGVPEKGTVIRAGDLLTCYGRGDASKKLSQRNKGPEGDEEHREEVEEEKKLSDERKKQEGYS